MIRKITLDLWTMHLKVSWNKVFMIVKVIQDYIDHSAGDFRSQKWKDHVFVGQKLEDYIEVKGMIKGYIISMVGDFESRVYSCNSSTDKLLSIQRTESQIDPIIFPATTPDTLRRLI